MSNYVKATNFTSKDALAIGNPLKIIKGTEFDVEFNAIATAITSKEDSTTAAAALALKANTTDVNASLALKAPLASPALTGTPTAPTAAVNNNTTQVATTAFVVAQIADDAPTKTGTGASGTWDISITGSASSATNASTVTTVTTAQVLGANAGASHQDVGSMTIAWNTTTGDVASNGNISGGSLRFTNSSAPQGVYQNAASTFEPIVRENNSSFPTTYTSTLAGTWKNIGGFCRGRAAVDLGEGAFLYYWYPSLWLRVA